MDEETLVAEVAEKTRFDRELGGKPTEAALSRGDLGMTPSD